MVESGDSSSQRQPTHEWSLARKHIRWAVIRSFAWSGLASLLLLGPTLYMLQVFDRVLVSRNEGTLALITLVTLALAILLAAVEWLRGRLMVHAGLLLNRLLSAPAWTAAFRLSTDRSDTRLPGNPLSDLTEVRQFLSGPIAVAMLELPWALVFFAVLWMLHPALGLAACAFALIQAFMVHLSLKRASWMAETTAAALIAAHKLWGSLLRQADVLVTKGAQKQSVANWSAQTEAVEQRLRPDENREHLLSSAGKWIRYSQQTLSLTLGAWLAIGGELSVGSMIAANVLMTRCLAPIDHVATAWKPLLAAMLAYRRLSSLLHDSSAGAPLKKQDTVRPKVGMLPRMGLELRQATVIAPGQDKPIFEKLDFAIRPGSITALIGPSGAGKSTLLRALLGIWPLASGQRLHDADLTGVDIGYLAQDVDLFAGSFAENIARMNDPDAAHVIEAATCVGLHEVILRFPQGYDTPVGTAGHLLSAGQRQRLALARAVYGNPRVIVLDEPNAHLDDEGERALVKALSRMCGMGCAILIVTHRANALASAHQVWRLQNGKVSRVSPLSPLKQSS